MLQCAFKAHYQCTYFRRMICVLLSEQLQGCAIILTCTAELGFIGAISVVKQQARVTWDSTLFTDYNQLS